MKKIFMLLAAVCAFASCDPVSEDISNGGHITAEELRAQSTVTLNGNVVTCSTSAPVNAKWTIAGKDLLGNSAWKKLKLGDQTIVLTGLCADGTELTAEYPISVTQITDPLEKHYIFQSEAGAPYVIPANGDAAFGRFSDNEGKGLPYLSDDVYFGKKTLIFDLVAEPADGGIWGEPAGPAMFRIMTGWWDPVFADEIVVPNGAGLWELPITDDIAAACAAGGGARDLTLLLRRGTVTINSIYYEE